MVVTLFKRVLCIFQKRRRKPSGDEIIMENVVIDNCKRNQDQFVPWNSWDDNRPPTVEDHIEQYRKSLTKLRTASEEIAHEPDFFNVKSFKLYYKLILIRKLTCRKAKITESITIRIDQYLSSFTL